MGNREHRWARFVSVTGCPIDSLNQSNDSHLKMAMRKKEGEEKGRRNVRKGKRRDREKKKKERRKK